MGSYENVQPVISTVNMELRSEFGLWKEIILTPGSEFLMDQTSLWWIWTAMKQKFQKISSKNMRLNCGCEGFCMPIKGQSKKPQRREPAGSYPRTVPIEKRTWIDIEPVKYSCSDFEVSKEVMYPSSSFTTCASRRRWSRSILEN